MTKGTYLLSCSDVYSRVHSPRRSENRPLQLNMQHVTVSLWDENFYKVHLRWHHEYLWQQKTLLQNNEAHQPVLLHSNSQQALHDVLSQNRTFKTEFGPHQLRWIHDNRAPVGIQPITSCLSGLWINLKTFYLTVFTVRTNLFPFTHLCYISNTKAKIWPSTIVNLNLSTSGLLWHLKLNLGHCALSPFMDSNLHHTSSRDV